MAIFKEKYIQLGEGLLPHEKQALEHIIETTFTPALPAESYISELEYELVEAAKQQQESQKHIVQGLRVIGWISGGLLSILGGVVMWMLWRQHRAQASPGEPDSDHPRFFEAASLSGA